MPHNDLQYESFNSSDLAALAVYYQTHPIPSTLEAGVVIASILVSVLGTSTTLLLLGRRTATNGFRNWALLVLAAITMASVYVFFFKDFFLSSLILAVDDMLFVLKSTQRYLGHAFYRDEHGPSTNPRGVLADSVYARNSPKTCARTK